MNTAPKIQPIGANTLPEKFYFALARIMYKLGIDGKEFVENITNAYIAIALENSPKESNSDVYATTGFGRTLVEKYKKNKDNNNKSKSRFHYIALVEKLKLIAEKCKDNIIPIYGKVNSYNAAYNKTKSPTKYITATSMLDQLDRQGIVERVGERSIRFISTMPTMGVNDTQNMIRHLSNESNRLFSTISHNLNIENPEDSLYQYSYCTTLIAPDNYRACTDKLRIRARIFMKDCQQIVDSFEESGFSARRAESNKIEIGISALIFNNQ